MEAAPGASERRRLAEASDDDRVPKEPTAAKENGQPKVKGGDGEWLVSGTARTGLFGPREV